MAPSPAQVAALRAAADRDGVDADALVAAAETLPSPSADGDGGGGETAETPKLFMYLLPFVRVREVRKIWLGLDEPFPGDNEVAAAWAAKFGGQGSDEASA